jgi:dihydroorotate dehydrogenase electron transfer subunit
LSRLFNACVTDNVEVSRNCFLLTLSPLDEIKMPDPGNFFMVSLDNGYDPLLKRPFSVHRCMDGTFQILYRVVGKGTGLLRNKKPGDIIEVIGPLGNTFPVRKSMKNIILVAGGIGIAPLFALAERLISPVALPKDVRKRGLKKKETGNTAPVFFYGARTKDELLCTHELSLIGIDPVISTDDGTSGQKGSVINVLKKYLSGRERRATDHAIFSCGPEPMLKALAELTEKKKLKAYASIEQNMACGLGTCLGCTVPTKTGYRRVCKEGPIFPLGDIVWE